MTCLLGKEATVLVLIFEMYATGNFARIRRIAYRAVLPLLIIRQRPLEVEGMIDISKSKLDIVPLDHTLVKL